MIEDLRSAYAGGKELSLDVNWEDSPLDSLFIRDASGSFIRLKLLGCIEFSAEKNYLNHD